MKYLYWIPFAPITCSHVPFNECLQSLVHVIAPYTSPQFRGDGFA